MSAWKELIKGLYRENPVFRLMLGLCPVLAVSYSVNTALGMGIAASFVLICSNFVVSIIRKGVPPKIRIPIYIMVIATFVTIVDLVMAAYQPELHKKLDIFIPLIVVNCIILGRAEAFASKHGPLLSVIDGIGMGVGFTFAMVVIATVREILGKGTWLGMTIIGGGFKDQAVKLMIMSPGAFLTIGFLIALFNWIEHRRKSGC
jgi:electron transport complex protein RnfE